MFNIGVRRMADAIRWTRPYCIKLSWKPQTFLHIRCVFLFVKKKTLKTDAFRHDVRCYDIQILIDVCLVRFASITIQVFFMFILPKLSIWMISVFKRARHFRCLNDKRNQTDVIHLNDLNNWHLAKKFIRFWLAFDSFCHIAIQTVLHYFCLRIFSCSFFNWCWNVRDFILSGIESDEQNIKPFNYFEQMSKQRRCVISAFCLLFKYWLSKTKPIKIKYNI